METPDKPFHITITRLVSVAAGELNR